MSDPYLLLWLEAPLQSWGHDSRFGRRDSLDFPTKSGVLGLLCCARGASGDERDWLAAWADLGMQVEGYVLQDRHGTALPRQPLLRDFHMVGSGYKRGALSSKDPDFDPWESLHIPLSADKKNQKVALTYRYYLQDMAYAVALQAPAALIDVAADALRSPVWDLYLGRKNCVPTEFIFQGRFDTAAQARQAGKVLAEQKKRAFALRVLQGAHEGEVLSLNDVPLQFGQHKKYRDRQVSVQKWEG